MTDEEPATTTTARRVLIVPVRSVDGARVVRLCRDPLGARVVVAFTSVARLRAVLGVEQEWIRLGAGAVRTLVDEVGGERMLVDPGLSAPPVRREASVGAVCGAAVPGGSGASDVPGVAVVSVVSVAVGGTLAEAARPAARLGAVRSPADVPADASAGAHRGGTDGAGGDTGGLVASAGASGDCRVAGVLGASAASGPSRAFDLPRAAESPGAPGSSRDPHLLGALRIAAGVAVLLVVLFLFG
ncbi:SAV_915 family protein [Embleya sp. NPDC050493]|uniref:SAV_915 family protein n=1 Tax=Embleya sp. NPDC050493 TaxID=3363989 RepID=UPI0037AC2F37